MLDAIIIGGGLSGLSAAYYAQQQQLNYTLLESSATLGGVLGSEQIGGYLIEKSAHTLLYSPLIHQLITDLSLQEQLIFPQHTGKHRYIYYQHKLHRIPSRPLEFLSSPLFDLAQKKQLLLGLLWRTPVTDEQSIYEFFTHYLGTHITETLVDSIISGIWAGDIKKLSLDACFPKLKQNTLTHRTLLQALKNLQPQKKRIFSFQYGTSTLINALANTCAANIKTQQQAQNIEFTQHNNNFTIHTQDKHYQTKKVIISTPIWQLPTLFKKHLNPTSQQKLQQLCNRIHYAPLSLVYSAYPREKLSPSTLQTLSGFGLLVPSNQHKKMLGTLFNHSLFQNRCPAEHILLTTFIGGAHTHQNHDLDPLDPSQLYSSTHQEIQKILNINTPPIWQHHHTWQQAIPQYHLGHQHTITQIKQLLNNPNIELNANWHEGTAVPTIIEKSSQLFG